ncbi:MAG: FKBP-type peptidyl-prolyl cis-trans isomerase [Myxococcota bacterium]
MQLRSLSVTLALSCAVLTACPKKNDAPPDSGVAATGATGASGKPAIEANDIPAPPDVAAPPADAQKTASGLAFKILKTSTSADRPEIQDTVRVHYTGWTASDGKMFDSSVRRGHPMQFGLRGVIKGWTEGLLLMAKGEKRRFWIPEDLAYKGGGGPQGMLVFEIELIDIQRGPKPIPAPADVAGAPADAKTTASGLAYKILSPGTGKKHPAAEDTVKVHYTGWTTDGAMFDSSVARGQPLEFPLNRVIRGWTEGMQLLVEGDKARLWIPQDLAYGGRPGAPAGMLVFDVELIGIKEAPKPIPAPADVKAAPAGAKKTKTGLAYKVLTKGKGTVHPTAQNMVEVHYTGWTAKDGKMFDSSVQRGQTAVFQLNQVIPGWTEGVQLMVEGEKTRFWIPEELAYKGMPGAPQGMLVFDVELIKIKK